jgi:hypothetical protein
MTFTPDTGWKSQRGVRLAAAAEELSEEFVVLEPQDLHGHNESFEQNDQRIAGNVNEHGDDATKPEFGKRVDESKDRQEHCGVHCGERGDPNE